MKIVEFIWKRLDGLEDSDILDMLAFVGEDVPEGFLDTLVYENNTFRDLFKQEGGVSVMTSKGPTRIKVGDYYILHADGYREVLTEYRFNKAYNELTSELMKEDI